MTTAETFVANLSLLMQRRQLSQRGLAQKMGIKHPYLSRIVTHKATPTLDFVEKVADALGVPVAEMLSDPRKQAKSACKKNSKNVLDTGSR